MIRITSLIMTTMFVDGYCTSTIPLGKQCGGETGTISYNCTDGSSPGPCPDAVWSGCTCASSGACTRVTQWCYVCGEASAPISNYLSAGPLDDSPAICLPNITANGTASYDWGCILRASMRFYDAQRSGRLPASAKIKWRGDTQLNDAVNGKGLVGGFFDAGGELQMCCLHVLLPRFYGNYRTEVHVHHPG